MGGTLPTCSRRSTELEKIPISRARATNQYLRRILNMNGSNTISPQLGRPEQNGYSTVDHSFMYSVLLIGPSPGTSHFTSQELLGLTFTLL